MRILLSLLLLFAFARQQHSAMADCYDAIEDFDECYSSSCWIGDLYQVSKGCKKDGNWRYKLIPELNYTMGCEGYQNLACDVVYCTCEECLNVGRSLIEECYISDYCPNYDSCTENVGSSGLPWIDFNETQINDVIREVQDVCFGYRVDDEGAPDSFNITTEANKFCSEDCINTKARIEMLWWSKLGSLTFESDADYLANIDGLIRRYNEIVAYGVCTQPSTSPIPCLVSSFTPSPSSSTLSNDDSSSDEAPLVGGDTILIVVMTIVLLRYNHFH